MYQIPACIFMINVTVATAKGGGKCTYRNEVCESSVDDRWKECPHKTYMLIWAPWSDIPVIGTCRVVVWPDHNACPH